MTIAIRPAPPLDSYGKRPWTRTFDEDRERLEWCVCGTYAVMRRGESITAVVRRHNDSPQHQAWRAERDAAL